MIYLETMGLSHVAMNEFRRVTWEKKRGIL